MCNFQCAVYNKRINTCFVSLFGSFHHQIALSLISYVLLLGKIYLITTLITAASSLAIFKHGSFNLVHVLALLTLLAVFAGLVLEKTVLFKSWDKYFVNLCFSSTLLFHLIPITTEILTRFPMDAPLVNYLKNPLLQKTFLTIFVVFIVF